MPLENLRNDSRQQTKRCSLIGLVELGTATNGQLAKLCCNLVRHAIEFLMTLAVRLIEE